MRIDRSSSRSTATTHRSSRGSRGTLAAIPETDGSTALDHTLIVWGNELGRGDHSLSNVPIVLFGGPLAGASSRGKLVDVRVAAVPAFSAARSSARLGMQSEGFGDSTSCGPIAGL